MVWVMSRNLHRFLKGDVAFKKRRDAGRPELKRQRIIRDIAVPTVGIVPLSHTPNLTRKQK